jgi:NADH:ubiquinone oxidoreductase subunit F (NADH-binding)
MTPEEVIEEIKISGLRGRGERVSDLVQMERNPKAKGDKK